MDNIIQYALAIFVVFVGAGVMTLIKSANTFMIRKADESFDASRSKKVSVILDMIEMNIATAITNYLSTKEYAVIPEDKLLEIAGQIADTVSNITGEGIIDFVIDTFADDWDEWLVEKVQESIIRQGKYEKE